MKKVVFVVRLMKKKGACELGFLVCFVNAFNFRTYVASFRTNFVNCFFFIKSYLRSNESLVRYNFLPYKTFYEHFLVSMSRAHNFFPVRKRMNEYCFCRKVYVKNLRACEKTIIAVKPCQLLQNYSKIFSNIFSKIFSRRLFL